MSKYHKLTSYLSDSSTDMIITTIDDLERALGIKLPGSARKHRAWWANQGHAQSAAWLAAGWKTANVDVESGSLAFARLSDDEKWAPDVAKLTIADAKAGLAANFGVSAEAVEIIIRG